MKMGIFLLFLLLCVSGNQIDVNAAPIREIPGISDSRAIDKRMQDENIITDSDYYIGADTDATTESGNTTGIIKSAWYKVSNFFSGETTTEIEPEVPQKDEDPKLTWKSGRAGESNEDLLATTPVDLVSEETPGISNSRAVDNRSRNYISLSPLISVKRFLSSRELSILNSRDIDKRMQDDNVVTDSDYIPADTDTTTESGNTTGILKSAWHKVSNFFSGETTTEIEPEVPRKDEDPKLPWKSGRAEENNEDLLAITPVDLVSEGEGRQRDIYDEKEPSTLNSRDIDKRMQDDNAVTDSDYIAADTDTTTESGNTTGIIKSAWHKISNFFSGETTTEIEPEIPQEDEDPKLPWKSVKAEENNQDVEITPVDLVSGDGIQKRHVYRERDVYPFYWPVRRHLNVYQRPNSNDDDERTDESSAMPVDMVKPTDSPDKTVPMVVEEFNQGVTEEGRMKRAGDNSITTDWKREEIVVGSDPVESIDDTNYIEEIKNGDFPYHAYSLEPVIVEDSVTDELTTNAEKELPPLKVFQY